MHGTDAVKEAFLNKKIKLIILTKDASERTKKNFYMLTENSDVHICEFGEMIEIGKAIGKTPKAVIGIKDINFSKEIIKKINGGEIIG